MASASVSEEGVTIAQLGNVSGLPSGGGGGKYVWDWQRDGVEAIKGIQYWARSAAQPGGEHTLSVSGDSLRINSNVNNTEGNQREAWLISDEDFSDFEILVRIDQPSNIGVTMTPQPGLMLRGTGVGEENGKAIAMFVNVFGSYGPLNVYNFRPWAVQGDGSVVDTGAESAGAVTMNKVTVPVRAAGIALGKILVYFADGVDSAAASQLNGQLVDYDSGDVITNGITDVNGKSFSSAFGYTLDSGGQSDVGVAFVKDATLKYSDISTANGTPVPPQAWYPAWLKVRLVGRQMKTKWWHSVLPEPRNWMNTVTLSENAPLSGKIGLVCNHLHGADNYIAYGPIEIQRLLPPST